MTLQSDHYSRLLEAYYAWVSVSPTHVITRNCPNHVSTIKRIQELIYECKKEGMDSKEDRVWKQVAEGLKKDNLTWYLDSNELDCCRGLHVDRHKNEALPDIKVCERERRWRTYVRIRDGIEHPAPSALQ